MLSGPVAGGVLPKTIQKEFQCCPSGNLMQGAPKGCEICPPVATVWERIQEKPHSKRTQIKSSESQTSCSSARRRPAEPENSLEAMMKAKKQMSTVAGRQAGDKINAAHLSIGPERLPAIPVWADTVARHQNPCLCAISGQRASSSSFNQFFGLH